MFPTVVSLPRYLASVNRSLPLLSRGLSVSLRPSTTASTQALSSLRPSPFQSSILPLCRTFTTTSSESHPSTPQFTPAATQNDLIKITDRCAEEVKKSMKKGFSYLRLGVDNGGCDGYQYLISFEKGEPRSDDLVQEYNGAKVVIDNMSLPIVRGAVLDFQKKFLEESIVVASNPNAVHSCGCKTSFTLVPGLQL
eukprot:TRINITY_DN3320_c0_g1_i1.p1 TRINITY_DN3320_c0_g1~~TRINITY_DN3320_c0_g1_i1.p1  ORF type:complete len:195 (+),score=32.21 TRINITY_DN3320_c0_g1_i1:208-792(+)